LEYLGLHNKPKGEVQLGHKLMGPKEEEEEFPTIIMPGFSFIIRTSLMNHWL
jgi:hypothetical protein